MKKKNKKINILYAFIYQLILIPIMGYVSYSIYNSTFLASFISSNMFVNSLILLILVALNIVAIYYISCVLNHIYKYELEYHIVIAMIVVFITIWFKIYYNSVEQTRCSLEIYNNCLNAMKLNNLFTTVLVLVVLYNLMYIPLHMITKKKGKKVKLSSIKN